MKGQLGGRENRQKTMTVVYTISSVMKSVFWSCIASVEKKKCKLGSPIFKLCTCTTVLIYCVPCKPTQKPEIKRG